MMTHRLLVDESLSPVEHDETRTRKDQDGFGNGHTFSQEDIFPSEMLGTFVD